MKYAMIAVLGLFILWILVETNMGRFYRIAYGDLVPPDVPYKGEKVEAYNVVLDRVVLPPQTISAEEGLCGGSCRWILESTPFDQIYLSFNESINEDESEEQGRYIAKLVSECKGWYDKDCIIESPVKSIPIKGNTLVFREYYFSQAYRSAYVNYLGREFCLGERVIARVGMVFWNSTTDLARFLDSLEGSIGEDRTGSMLAERDQIDHLFQETVQVNQASEGSSLCPNNLI